MVFKTSSLANSEFVNQGIGVLDYKKIKGLSSRKYSKTFVEVPNRALPQFFQVGIEIIFSRLGLPYNPEDNTILVKADSNGTYERFYYPNTYGVPGKGICEVRWGSNYIDLAQFLKIASPVVQVDQEKKSAIIEFELQLTEEEQNKYKFEVLCFPIKLFFNPDADFPNAAVIRNLIINEKKGFQGANLSKLLKEKGSNIPLIKMQELGVISLDVVGFSASQSGKFGVAYVLNCVYNPEDKTTEHSYLNYNDEEKVLKAGDKINIWARGNAESILAGLPKDQEIITPQFPARLEINKVVKKSDGKYSVSNTLNLHPDTYKVLQAKEESYLSLDW